MNWLVESDQVCTMETKGRCELDENLEIFRNVSVFAGIPFDQLRLYAYLSKRLCYRAGEYLFRQGDVDDRGFIVVSGRVQVVREIKDRSIRVNQFKEGDFFGGLALLSNTKRIFSAKSDGDVRCLTLDRASFRKLLIQCPEVGIQILDMVVGRIAEMEERLLQSLSIECVQEERV